MRACFPQMVGNGALCARIGSEMAAGTHAHAYILEGARGYGKHTMAMEMAMAATCENRQSEAHPLPCGSCKACRKMRTGACPDIILVKKPEDRATMGVDVIRQMRQGISMVPSELDLKIYMIEDAHLMTEEAQNALLLTLEEPPPFVLFLLLAEDASLLLETVRSRAPILRLQPLREEELRAALTNHLQGAALLRERPEEFEELLLLSDGALGKALSLLEPKTRAPHLARRKKTAELLRLLAARERGEGLLTTLLALPKAREELREELLTLSSALRDMVLLCQSEACPLLFFTDKEAALELSAARPACTWLDILGAVEDTLTALSQNANVRLAITHLISRLG